MNPLVLMAGIKGAAHAVDRVISRSQHTAPARPSNSKTDFAQMLMQRLDGDGNGTITRSEAGIESALFEKLDANADGVLDRSELEKGAQRVHRSLLRQQAVTERFGLLDSNRDGVLSLTESGKRESEFQRADRNLDERLQLREWSRAHGARS